MQRQVVEWGRAYRRSRRGRRRANADHPLLRAQASVAAASTGPNGYREYDASILTRLAFIRSGQAAGLTLVEIASILDLRGEGAVPCAHVQMLLSTKLHDVQARQRELALLEAELEELISRSHDLDPADCTDQQICHIIAGA